MRVLLIEDDSATAQSMELMLKSEGFNCYTTDLGEEGVDLAKVYDYDAIILDLNLPDISGVEVLRQVRGAGLATPVLIVSGTSDISMKVKTLDLGADDYLSKPFHKDEMVARLRAVIRRSAGHPNSIITVGEIAVNLSRKYVEAAGQRIHLTGKEYLMAELLALRRGQTITKEMFLNHLYGGIDEPELKIIDVFICRIRNKLAGANDGVHHIETVWGRGYRLSDNPEAQSYSKAPKGSLRAHILRTLERGVNNVPGLAINGQFTVASISAVLSKCMTEGLVLNRGVRGKPEYFLTGKGRARLAEIEPAA